MSNFQPFLLERVLGKLEQEVEFNLSESGVHPVILRDLLENDPEKVDMLLNTDLNYPYVNGILELRENIAGMYTGAHPDNVLVTVGAIEANYITTRTLLSPGDEIVVMLPNYLQIWGIAKNHELNLKTFSLKEEKGWAPDLSELEEKVSDKTKLIAICNPNNPTGRILTEQEMDGIIAAADRAGAWILADEVYRGAERETDVESPSFFGKYDKVLAVGSVSKAYGIPGLRIGWIVAPPETLDLLRTRHEYVTICSTMLANKLASLALSPEMRPKLIQRTRDYIRKGYPVLEKWLNNHDGMFRAAPPQAAAIAFARYNFDINSTKFMERLAAEKGVLIVPGDFFGMDHFIRISYGLPEPYLTKGLDRIHDLVTEIN